MCYEPRGLPELVVFQVSSMVERGAADFLFGPDRGVGAKELMA